MHFALLSSVLSLLLLNSSPVLAVSTNDAKAAFAVRPEQHIILGFPKKAQRNSPIFVTFSENSDPKLYPGLQYNASLSVFSPSGEMLQSDLPAGAATVDAFSETGCLNRPGNGTVSGISFDTVGMFVFSSCQIYLRFCLLTPRLVSPATLSNGPSHTPLPLSHPKI
jgi:hypothetical protein